MLTTEYIAGFFDGEGCVIINKSGKRGGYSVRTSVTNTNLEMLKVLQVMFGVGLYITSPPNHRTVWSWQLGSKKAAAFLQKIRPYIILKRAQVELGLALWEFQQRPLKERCQYVNGPRGHYYERTEATRKQEEEFKQQMHELNRRGMILN